MSLPFLKPKRVAGLIIANRKPDGSKVESHEEGKESDSLEICAQDIIRAIENKDSKALAMAFKAAFEICESYPEEQESDGSYDDQNALAGKEQE